MATQLCKALRKDGSPCRGHALDKYSGFCIAHGPTPEQAREWRALGGRNSAAAVRLGKNTPERFTEVHDILDDCIKMVIDGSLSTARFDAVCRGLQMKLDTYQLGDQEMERFRNEQVQAAAAQHLDVNPNLDVLEAADRKKAEQDQYRRESLVHQGFARFEKLFNPFNPDDPPDVVLNDKGRRCFGYHGFAERQGLLEEMEDTLVEFDADSPRVPDLAKMTGRLELFQEEIEKTRSALPHVDALPHDPLTGKPLTKLPAGVTISPYGGYLTDADQDPRDRLAEQLYCIDEVKQLIKETSERELYKRRLAEQEQGDGNRARAEARLHAKSS